MSRHTRGFLAIAIAIVAAMAAASAASAEVTESHVNSPGEPHFSLFSPENETVFISGTSNGTTGDEVDLLCFYGSPGTAKTVEAGVPVTAGGSFEITAPLDEAVDQVCRLRAVPAGEVPSDLSPFSGPLLATGEYGSEEHISGGPNDGKLYDYYAWAQQIGAAFDYVSAGNCGIYDGYLFDSTHELTATTFYCNDGFENEDGEEPTGSQIQVDGANAYLPEGAERINPEASGLPSLSYSVSQDPANGDTTIRESDGIVECADPAFPPSESSCSSYLDTGVRLDREIVQSDDGHLATITDRFASSDGEAHSLRLLSENFQYFGDSGEEELEYRFPGQVGYTKPRLGDSVAFPDSSPGSIYVRVEGAPDGETETGQGAIVFERPSSPATFNYENSSQGFYFHQTVAVPAAGTSAPTRFAYAQAFGQSEVEALARKAEAAFAPVPLTPVSSTQAPAPVAPSNRIKFRRAKLNKKNGTALLRVWVPGAGKLTLSGHKVKTVKRHPKRAGVLKLKVAAKPKFAKTLRRKGKLKVAMKLVFKPTGGTARTAHRRLTLVRR